MFECLRDIFEINVLKMLFLSLFECYQQLKMIIMKTIFLSIVILTFVACHKENILPDNIIYTDLQPDTLISSIDTVYYLGYDDSAVFLVSFL